MSVCRSVRRDFRAFAGERVEGVAWNFKCWCILTIFRADEIMVTVCWFSSVWRHFDLVKAFDRVPRKVLWWAMRKVGVEEWIVRLVQAMYNNARSRVRVGSEYSEEFEVGVGVHQGSVLSPLLFIIVLEALSRDFRVGVPWELFFADDLVIIATSLEECVERVKAWKEGLESKGLHVNMTKTKFMASGLGLDILQDSGKFPCAVCRTGVGRSSIRCSKCNLWVPFDATLT